MAVLAEHLRHFSMLVACFALLLLSGGAVGQSVINTGGGYDSTPLWAAWQTQYAYYEDTTTINYDSTLDVSTAFTMFLEYSLDLVTNSAVISSDELESLGGFVQMPVVGSAIVLVYNLPSIGDSSLVLDRDTVARIWLGNITYWDDQAITKTNPNLTSTILPHQPITLSYFTSETYGIGQSFAVALSKFSVEFAEAYSKAGQNFSNMAPAQNGRAFGFNSYSLQHSYVQNTTYSMTYINNGMALQLGLPFAQMVNKDGATVTASADSITAAMEAYDSEIEGNNTVVDISDASGNETWPMSYLICASLTIADTPYDGCAPVTAIFALLTWAELNNQAAISMNDLGYSVLTPVLRSILLNTFSTITCFGNAVYFQTVVQGIGADLIMIPSWMGGYSETSIYFKYYTDTLDTALAELKQGSVDFALAQGNLTDEQQADIPDAQTIPLFSYGVAPAYNVPELIPVGQMNYTWEIMAGILLGEITRWNDSAIAAVNPGMVGYLPDQPIRVIYLTVASQYTLLWSTALAQAVESFGEKVTPGLVVELPEAITNSSYSIALDDTSEVADTLGSVNYAFTVWDNLELWPISTIVYGPMVNSFGISVNCTQPYMLNTIEDFKAELAAVSGVFDLYLPSGEWSWPMLTWGTVVIHTRQSGQCDRYSNMLDWIWWTQTNEYADILALGNAAAVVGTAPVIQRKILTVLANATCDGEPAFSLYGCIYNGTLCSNAGTCDSGNCTCYSGYSGAQCQISETSSGLSTGEILAIILGIFIPAIVLVLCCIALATVLLLWIQRRNRKKDDWEIDPDEVEMGNVLGVGGFGEVHKARWRGTEVAVKMMHSKEITKEMERHFKEEIRVMTALRHPNVVLFMAASTKPPKMCIVMEFMALGSLYDLLHNELVPALPSKLKYKMAYQAAKGMHFLHSSGIVHRDLKSLNLLLDNKWNIKVSDFGLTKFRQEVKDKAKDQRIHGTIHWTAPEVLSEEPDADYMLADVYSFGIILWELYTRQEPYAGMSPAAVAVAVIRDGMRPSLTEVDGEPLAPEYEELMKSCWHSDPVIRPSFLEAMTRLNTLGNDGSGLTSSFKSSTSSSLSSEMQPNWSVPSTTMSSTSSSRRSASRSHSSAYGGAAAADKARAPQGLVTIVFTDIVRAASLWEFAPSVMRDATLLHNELLRDLLKQHNGYEVASLSRDNDRTSGMGSFCMAFQEPVDALEWCMAAQKRLLAAEWPDQLLEHPGAAEELGDVDDRVIYRGLRVRMGVHLGQPKVTHDPLTRRVEYHGPPVDTAGRLTSLTHGGQIVISGAVHDKIKEHGGFKVQPLGRFAMPDTPQGVTLHELKVPGLEARFFGGVTDRTTEQHSAQDSDEESESMQTAVGDGLEFKEDNFLTSANLCRWVINFSDIQLGRQVGMGSYGAVYQGKWKGVEVAVKRFIKQKIDERSLLDFRAEMAVLSELHHPNIVLFIGACVKMPDLCIVTEFLQRGSLKEILLSNTTKLTWLQKMRMLRSAAVGVNYLHSLEPAIVHRDLKPSNLLVDENWNVKVADFGFARIKEVNATMTRCGSPCWTAPEIIRGEKYSEKVDVYSFGIIMWEVITRRQPFAGHNFMGVSLDVLEGRRPQIPADLSKPLKKMIKRSWHAEPDKRPTMEQLVTFLDGQLSSEEQV